MGKINKEWHQVNKMPKHPAPREERFKISPFPRTKGRRADYAAASLSKSHPGNNKTAG